MAKYIDADLLRKEIDNVEEEARKVRVSGTDKEAIGADGKVKLCLELKAIINSLQQGEPEKPIPNDLEEAADTYKNCYSDPNGALARASKRAFIAGAKWDREQLLKDAIHCEVFWYDGFKLDYTQEQQDAVLDKIGAHEGDKVRIIIVKEEN